MSKKIVLDTETTGLSYADGDRLVEIGCIEIEGRTASMRRFHCYLNPEREVPDAASRIHGLTNAFLADKPTFASVADDFIAFISGSELIIHNAKFDLGFLNAELARLQRPPVESYQVKVVDTVVMARSKYPGKKNDLDSLCKRLGVDNAHRELHGALKDAELLAGVYLAMTRGQEALFDEQTVHAEMALHHQGKSWELPIVTATVAELLEHQQILRQLEQTSGGKTVWTSPASQ